MLGLAISKTNDRDAAEELVQNVFVKLYEHKNLLSTDTSIRAYLYVILKNQVLNHYRSQLVRNKYEDHISIHHSITDDSMIERIEARELEQQINAEIDLLPEKCRNVFILSRKEYLSNKEIAERLSISENTVEQHIRKAIRRLRASLATIIELGVLWFFVNK